jgi:hypothetical protein
MKRGRIEGVAQPGNNPVHYWRKSAVPEHRRRVNREARAAAREIARMRQP